MGMNVLFIWTVRVAATKKIFLFMSTGFYFYVAQIKFQNILSSTQNQSAEIRLFSGLGPQNAVFDTAACGFSSPLSDTQHNNILHTNNTCTILDPFSHSWHFRIWKELVHLVAGLFPIIFWMSSTASVHLGSNSLMLHT